MHAPFHFIYPFAYRHPAHVWVSLPYAVAVVYTVDGSTIDEEALEAYVCAATHPREVFFHPPCHDGIGALSFPHAIVTLIIFSTMGSMTALCSCLSHSGTFQWWMNVLWRREFVTITDLINPPISSSKGSQTNSSRKIDAVDKSVDKNPRS